MLAYGRWYLTTALMLLVQPHNVMPQWEHYCEIELSFKIVCYYTNWAQYRPGFAQYTIDDIDPCLCTHILFAFARVENNQIFSIEGNDEEMYKKLYNLKPINADLSNILSVGGDLMGVTEFEYIVGSPQNRTTFSQNALQYLKDHRFDGIDIDWEFPESIHKNNLTLLLKEIRQTFHNDVLEFGGKEREIMCALAAQSSIMLGSYDYPEIAKYIDLGNVMTYDLHGGWDSITGFHSALHGYYPGDEFSQAWVVNKTLDLGFPVEKLVLGIPTYGRSFQLCNHTMHDIRAPACGFGEPAPQTNNSGTMAYFEICRKQDFKYVYDESQQVPYEYHYDLWVSYDNVQSLQRKKKFAQDMKLGGVMIWDLSMDDFADKCGDGPYPLLKVFNPSTAVTRRSGPITAIACVVLTLLLGMD